MRDCSCPKPLPHTSPNKDDTCCRCGFYLNPAWSSNDHTFAAFMDRLEEAVKGRADKPPDSFVAFRAQCEQRERTGREKFGYEYLVRDNAQEATEEFADAANYMGFLTLQNIRAGAGTTDVDSALMACFHSYKAWCYALEAKAKRGGYTGNTLPE